MRTVSLLAPLIVSSHSGFAAEARAFSTDELARAIASLPKTPPTNREILSEGHYALKVAVVDHRNGPGEVHDREDRVFYILGGSAELRVGGSLDTPRQISEGERQGIGLKDSRTLKLAAGTVISVPRGTPYQLVAENSRVSFLVVRIEGQ